MAYNYEKNICDTPSCLGVPSRLGYSGSALCEECYREKLIAEVFDNIPEEVDDGEGSSNPEESKVSALFASDLYEWAGVLGPHQTVYQAG